MLVPSANTFNFTDPRASFRRVNPLSHLMQDFYFKPDLEAMLSLFWPFPTTADIAALRPLMRARVNYVMMRQAHAVIVHAWDNHLVSPGYSEYHLCYMKEEFKRTEDTRLCSPDWDESAFPALTMERRTLEQRDHVGRFALVAEWNQSILALVEDVDADERPNAHALWKMWGDRVLLDDARGPLDQNEGTSPDIMRRVMYVLRAYIRRVKRALAEMLELAEACRENNVAEGVPAAESDDEHELGDAAGKDAEDLLLRPTALFVCAECGRGPYPYPEINVHWQSVHWDKSVWMHALWDEGAYGEGIIAVLVNNGLTEHKRDLWRLDELIGEGRVFCSCGDPDMKKPEEDSSWAELVNHVSIHLGDNALRTKTVAVSLGMSEAAGDMPIWLNDHDLASCIKYLPEGADSSEASKPLTADESTRERVDALLKQCLETSLPACRLCDSLTPDDKKDDTLFLPESADAMVYHMQAKHGKHFEEKDIMFWNESIFNQPQPLNP